MNESTGELPPDVEELMAQGRKIEAIKRLRELTGLGLSEAKDAVEGGVSPGSGSARMSNSMPRQPNREDSGTGRFLLILLAIGAIGLLYGFFA